MCSSDLYGLSSTRHTYDWLTAFEAEVMKHDETTPQRAGQCLNLGRRQRAHEAFLHHEGREGAEMPVLAGAAMNRIGAADGAVGSAYQRLPAARAGHVFLQRTQPWRTFL